MFIWSGGGPEGMNLLTAARSCSYDVSNLERELRLFAVLAFEAPLHFVNAVEDRADDFLAVGFGAFVTVAAQVADLFQAVQCALYSRWS